jgi:TolA-binding protein
MRSRVSESDSLDLLLDTICNTFGGILFISLLVVIMINTSRPQATPTPQEIAAMREASRERNTLMHELEQLRQSVATIEGSEHLVAPELMEQAREYQRQRSERAELVMMQSRVTGNLTDAQAELNDIAINRAALEEKLRATKEMIAAAKQQLSEYVDEKSRSADIPKESDTNLSGVVFFLVKGRLFGPLESVDRYDSSDFVVQRQSLFDVAVEITPGGGDVIDPTDWESVPSSAFTTISHNHAFVRIYVWSDSYHHFDSVRRYLVSAGFKYELIPMEEYEPVHFQLGSGGGGRVQG